MENDNGYFNVDEYDDDVYIWRDYLIIETTKGLGLTSEEKGTFLEKSIRIMVQKKGEMDSIKKVNDDHDDRRKLMVCFYTW